MRYYVVRTKDGPRLRCANERRATAIHEAGHAVLAHYLGHRVTWIHFGPCRSSDGERHGCTHVLTARKDPFGRALWVLGGHEAEHRLCGRPIGKLPEGDWKTIERLGLTKKSAGVAGWCARRIVAVRVREIRRVARALQEAGSLNRRQFLAAMRKG